MGPIANLSDFSYAYTKESDYFRETGAKHCCFAMGYTNVRSPSSQCFQQKISSSSVAQSFCLWVWF